MSNDHQTEAAAIAALASVGKVHTEGAAVPFLVLPGDCKVQGLEHLQASPLRVREAVTMTSVESFIEYLKARKTDRTVIFADEAKRTLKAVIDYHGNGGEPAWGDHKVEYTATLSREWQAWHGKHNQAIDQIAFADFIEERVAHIVDPAGATMLEMATKFSVVRKATFGSAIRLNSGEYRFEYADENQAKGTIQVPEKFKIGIPVFHRGAAYGIDVRLRYRLGDGKVVFTMKIVEPEHVVETAFGKQRTQVAEALAGVPIYDGSK